MFLNQGFTRLPPKMYLVFIQPIRLKFNFLLLMVKEMQLGARVILIPGTQGYPMLVINFIGRMGAVIRCA